MFKAAKQYDMKFRLEKKTRPIQYVRRGVYAAYDPPHFITPEHDFQTRIDAVQSMLTQPFVTENER